MRIYLLKRKGQLSKESEAQGKSKKISLYLMYHFPGQAKREYEWLNLYLYDKPKNQIEKDHNKSTWQLAETIKAKRVVDAQTTAHGFISKVRSRICFVAFFKKQMEKKYTSDGNYGNWKSTYEHLLKFTEGREVPMDRIDERWLENFKEYLGQCTTIKGKQKAVKLNPNSQSSYFNKIRAALRIAFNQRMIKENPASRVKCIKGKDSHREFLTLEELQKLAATECELPMLKQLFLCSALTGLRYSDLKNLRWGNIMIGDSGYYIQYTQQKTKKAERLPVADHVIKMMGEGGAADEVVFKGYQYSAWNNLKLKQWVMAAGINKTKISLHSGRHTFASLNLFLGTDIAVISKMLGHSSISVTQIYAKVQNLQMVTAVNKIPQLTLN